ncbi:MAG TPA: ADOP family duplicated permease [Gemmatimonadaceae bacterium]|jgi:predicted permease
MSRIPGLRRFFRVERDGAGIQRAVDDELQFHFDMTVRDLMAKGMNADDARREARRRFGDVDVTRSRLSAIDRSVVGRERRAAWWSAFAQDFRYAVRSLRLQPGFAIAVILTLGLGIGANATMFQTVDRLLFRPPAYLATPDRVGRLYLTTSYRGQEFNNSYTGYRPYLDLRENTTSFDAMTPFYASELAVGTGDATREMKIGFGDADFWKMFDIKPVIGRFYTPAEADPQTTAHVVVLSYGFWQTQYGGHQDVLGRQLDIGPAKYTIIGVAPESFSGFSPDPVVAFLSVAGEYGARQTNLKDPWYATYHMQWLEVFARRKPGVSAAQATADLTRAFQISYRKHLADSKGMTPFELARPHAAVGPVLRDRGPNGSTVSKVVVWLMGVAVIVLLIACANVANLLVARALRRRREIAVRIALGVSRARLLTQLTTESMLLAVLAGVAALVIAQAGNGAMMRMLLDQKDGTTSAITDGRLLIVVALLAAAAGLLTGIAPILQTSRGDITSALKSGAREGTVYRSKLRISLLIAQAALSVVLLVGAGLFLQSLANVERIRLGYDVDKLLWVDSNMRGLKTDSATKIALSHQLLAQAKAIPGVQNAALALTVPFWSTWDLGLYVAGIDSVGKLGDFTLQAASPEVFSTVGTRILRGRAFTDDDNTEHAPRVMVVGESMAKTLWPGQDAIGKCVRMNADTMPCHTVIGVAEDIRDGTIDSVALHYYIPIVEYRTSGVGLFVRTRGSPVEQAETVRRMLQKLMPGASYVTVTPMSTIIAPTMRSWKIGATLFTIFGALALVLATIGLYSVIAYNVAQRTHEMGVRVALGAQARDIIGLIVREGLGVVLPGVALGAVIALFAGRWIAPLLFHVSPKDPPVLISVIVALIAVAIAASWMPARRAARVDPNTALRSE